MYVGSVCVECIVVVVVLFVFFYCSFFFGFLVELKYFFSDIYRKKLYTRVVFFFICI